MNAYQRYFIAAQQQLDKAFETQTAAVLQAAQWLGEALVNDRWLYAFGTGHSHMLAEEIFYRAGGLAHACPILDDLLMLHKEAVDATYLERKEGYAAGLLAHYPVESGDILLVASNSGRNAVPIELAMLGRERGMKVITITNHAQMNAWPSRHSSGKHLAEVGDLAIDNCGIEGDAAISVAGMPSAIGPTSSITGLFLLNAIIVQAIEYAVAAGKPPEIYISSNTNGDPHNNLLLEKYRSRIRHL
jgi:uncharacterized phosphosugar-binding protein